ncbi:hypothetical protein GC194_13180 [bacterium]|nr:hypothetical protein [bacterium]
MSASLRFEMPSKLRITALAIMAIGLVLGIASFVMYGDTPTRVWAAFLLNNFYFLALGIAGAVIMAIGYVAHAGWNIVQKRIMEAMAVYMPIGIIGMLVVGVLGMPYLYEWSHADIVAGDSVLQAKEWFLNKGMYFGLTIFALLVWTGLQFILRKHSIAEDNEGGTKRFWKSYKTSATFMVLWAFSFCAAVFLWIMSLEPHWYSTIFAVYVFASVLVLGFTFINMASIYLNGRGVFPWFNTNHMHDTSKFMFAFSIFWGYIFVSQLLLIWYANIPEETPYYLLRWGRTKEGFNIAWLWYLNIVLNFVTPFLVFMTRESKRQVKVVMLVAFIMIIAKWIDFYLLIMPSSVKFANHMEHMTEAAHHTHLGFGVPEIGFFMFFAGLFIYVVGTALSKANIIPKNHPYIIESIQHHI